jgi:hypothetical protein
MVFAAKHAASARVHLPETVHPSMPNDFPEIGGTWGGVYLVGDDGFLGGAVWVPRPQWPHNGETLAPYAVMPMGSALKEIPAGAYTVYVLGDGPVEITLDLRSNELGLAVTATTPARAVYRDVESGFPAGVSSAVRLPIDADGGWAGIAGGWYDAGPTQPSTIRGCLARPGSGCTADDPSDESFLTVTAVSGLAAFSVDFEPGFLTQRRDVVGRADANSSAESRLAVWYVAVLL